MKITKTLTDAERNDLEQHEQTVCQGLETFVEVGTALCAIRDGRLYRETHGTFADYCEEVFSLKVRRAYQLMGASEVAKSVQNFAHSVSEGACNELAKVEPEQRETVLVETTKGGGKPTAKAIKAASESVQNFAHSEDTKPDEPSRIIQHEAPQSPQRFGLLLHTLITEASERIGYANPSRRELTEAALSFRKLAADLEKAAAGLE